MADALRFNVSALRAARRCRLAELEMAKGPDASVEQMSVVIAGKRYIEG